MFDFSMCGYVGDVWVCQFLARFWKIFWRYRLKIAIEEHHGGALRKNLVLAGQKGYLRVDLSGGEGSRIPEKMLPISPARPSSLDAMTC